MIKRTLRPSIGNEVDAVEGIEYGIWRDDGIIGVEYDLYGLLSHLVFPAGHDPVTVDRRSDGLWRHTCFELFVKEVGERNTRYLECNFSPSGDWNVYSFGSYQKEMLQVEGVKNPIITVEKTEKIFSLMAEVDLAGLVPDASAVMIGVACVVENVAGKLGYWALVHPGDTPDFHDPRSFILRLDGTDQK